MMSRFLWTFVCVFVMASGLWAQSLDAFTDGNELYKNGDYSGAIARWETILDQGQHSAAVYFNLGNAHYKLNQIGPSIYYYEKALDLSPGDADIRNNLAFARNATVDAIDPLPTSVFKRWYAGLTGLFSFDGWAMLVVMWMLLFSSCFLLYYYGRSERRKRIFFVLAFSSLGMAVIALFLAYQVKAQVADDRPAIIFAERTEVLSEPTRNSDLSFVLHEGTKVQILANEGEWVRIRISDGQDGWMRLADLKPL